jgi:hypothetical protein
MQVGNDGPVANVRHRGNERSAGNPELVNAVQYLGAPGNMLDHNLASTAAGETFESTPRTLRKLSALSAVWKK